MFVRVPIFPGWRLRVEADRAPPRQPPNVNARAALFGSALTFPLAVLAAWIWGNLSAVAVLELWLFGIAGACTVSARRPRVTRS